MLGWFEYCVAGKGDDLGWVPLDRQIRVEGPEICVGTGWRRGSVEQSWGGGRVGADCVMGACLYAEEGQYAAMMSVPRHGVCCVFCKLGGTYFSCNLKLAVRSTPQELFKTSLILPLGCL